MNKVWSHPVFAEVEVWTSGKLERIPHVPLAWQWYCGEKKTKVTMITIAVCCSLALKFPNDALLCKLLLKTLERKLILTYQNTKR